MSKIFIEESSLTAIGDAIRAKTGKSDLLSPAQMVTAIGSISGGGGGTEVEPMVLSGSQLYGCAGDVSRKYLQLFGDTITTNGLSGFSLKCLKRVLFSVTKLLLTTVPHVRLFFQTRTHRAASAISATAISFRSPRTFGISALPSTPISCFRVLMRWSIFLR